MDLGHTISSHDQVLTLLFPDRITSTTVSEVRESVQKFLDSRAVREAEPTVLTFDFRSTQAIDSLGLNLIFELVKWSDARAMKRKALVRQRSVHMVLLNVRLDKKMELVFEPGPAVGSAG